jgi:hypothetical protein
LSDAIAVAMRQVQPKRIYGTTATICVERALSTPDEFTAVTT